MIWDDKPRQGYKTSGWQPLPEDKVIPEREYRTPQPTDLPPDVPTFVRIPPARESRDVNPMGVSKGTCVRANGFSEWQMMTDLRTCFDIIDRLAKK